MSKTIQLTAADGHQFAAYEAGDPSAKRGLVVVQEIFGVNHHIRHVCDRLAAFGYHIVSPAMFDRTERGVELGYQPDDIQRGIALRAKIADAGALADIAACAAYLNNKPTGIIGYCWGGTLSWQAATQLNSFKAASCWYGGGIAATATATPNCPVQMHFGAEDHGIPLSDVDIIKSAHPGMHIFVYDGAGHGFGCNERASYNPAEAELAELRSLAFFAAHLRA
ncbi:MAG: carboxymethylenebutenolidase [Rhodospirillales bacterium 20-60-12]|nr:MAG: carboxymethylenebutenolidase [Rhodospirillales bacterium 20-60-12]